MTPENELMASRLVSRNVAGGAQWIVSWPLLTGVFTYFMFLSRGNDLLLDGDTYWHIAAGQLMLREGSVPKVDPFSHTMAGAPWTAHEWLAEVMLAAAHQAGGWPVVVAVTALAFAATIALMTRALLRWLEPIYALLFAGMAVAMTAGHVLARPHMLAMPLMVIWTVELVRASESRLTPALWLLPLMTIWANLHGGFTLGIALAGAMAIEAVINARREERTAIVKSWSLFLALSVIFALITPHGVQGILFTWQILFEHSYALERIGEWRSPDFHTFQPLELWLLCGLAVALHQGLRLPPVRLALLIGLIHLALKHVRYIELVGLLAPLFLAAPFAAHWRLAQQGKQQSQSLDRAFRKLAQPAGQGAVFLCAAILVTATLWWAKARPPAPNEALAPALAIKAVQHAGIKGPVLNSYETGGYLIYMGIAPFIDGRNDVYGDAFLKRYIEALELRSGDDLQKVLDQYKIAWTLLTPGSSAVAMLDHMPQWRRLYADKTAVVHIYTGRPDVASGTTGTTE
jgi:hypothetical protein